MLGQNLALIIVSCQENKSNTTQINGYINIAVSAHPEQRLCSEIARQNVSSQFLIEKGKGVSDTAFGLPYYESRARELRYLNLCTNHPKSLSKL